MGVDSFPKTVTRQCRDCDLNPGPSAPEPSTLTTRLPSHQCMRSWFYETVERLSVRPSVCPVDQQQQRRAAGLLLSAPRAGNIDRQLRTRPPASGAGA